MKLHADISGTKHEVELKKTEGNVHAVVNGREYNLEVSEPEPNVFLFKDDGKIDEILVSKTTGEGSYLVAMRSSPRARRRAPAPGTPPSNGCERRPQTFSSGLSPRSNMIPASAHAGGPSP